MLRLMGLPHVARYPEATVTRGADHFSIRFGGPGREQTVSVPTRYVGGDEEEAELRLLAQLQVIGYRVKRGTPRSGSRKD
jgi:hypothetical protein